MQNIRDPRFEKPGGRATLCSEVRSELEGHAPELEALLAGPETGGIELAQRRADLMDRLLRTLYHAAVDELGSVPPVLFAAVGGYGRRLLGWKSDLDVRLLTTELPERLEPLAEAIFYPLWDAGVSVGHQVVTIDSLIKDAQSDLPTATALLDLRPIAGDLALAHALNERAYAELFAPPELDAFLDRLQAQLQARRARMNDATYWLEPELKNGVGGLRDLDCALWATGARWQIRDLAELCRFGLLSAQELEDATAALALTWSARNRLHRAAERKSDRLTFADQERISAELGYAARAGVSADARDPAAVEAMTAAFMSDYLRQARNLAEVSERLLARCVQTAAQRPTRDPETPYGLCHYGAALGLADSVQLELCPELALQLLAAAVEQQLPVHRPSREAIQRACANPDFAAGLRASSLAAALFVNLVGETRPARLGSESIVAELLGLGLLTALIPEFAPLVSKAHHDTYHVYTVDVHSMYAVDCLRALARGEQVGESALASRLASEHADGRSELLLATLLHDIGKAKPGPGHAQRGAEMARVILRRLQLPPAAIDEICLLICEHLSMYKVAMHRDLTDSDAIASFGRRVGNRRLLAQLYLLTVADVRTTSPTSMTQWKNHMLDELYAATEAWLEGGATRTKAVSDTGQALQGAPFAQFVESMPARYLRSSSVAEASMHARAAQEVGDGNVHVACIASRCATIAELCIVTQCAGPATGLTIVAEDRPGLLVLITAALAANRLEVYAAEIHTRRLQDGSAQGVDRFWVRPPGADVARVAARIASVEQDLKRLLKGEISARTLLETRKPSQWGQRPVPDVASRVILDHDASAEFTVIEVLTKDQPGLLFMLAETLRALGLSTALAKISTEGARATDAFYVTELTGEKLARGARSHFVEQRLLAALTFDAALVAAPAPNYALRSSYQA